MLLWLNLMGATSTSGGGGGNPNPNPTPVISTTPASRRLALSASLTSKAMAEVFSEAMDPYEILDFEVDVTNLLAPGEAIQTYSLSLPTESQLLGLEIQATAPYTIERTNNIIRFWLGVISEEHLNPVYNAGATLPIQINILTNTGTTRRRQRTVAVQVFQR